MGEDRESAERSIEDDLSSLRHARFGQLPDQVRLEDLVETVEADLQSKKADRLTEAERLADRFGSPYSSGIGY